MKTINEVKAFAVASITTKMFPGIGGDQLISTGCKMIPELLFVSEIPNADFGGYQHVWRHGMRPVSQAWLVIAGFKTKAIVNGESVIIDKTKLMCVSDTDLGLTFCYLSLNPADYRVFSAVEDHSAVVTETRSAITGIDILPNQVMALCRECISAFPETAGYLDKQSRLFPATEISATLSSSVEDDSYVDMMQYA